MNEEQLKRIDRHVGQQLRKARVLRDMSQENLATAINLTFQQIQKYERGTNRLSASRMYQISKILNVRPAYFFEGLPEGEYEEIALITIEHMNLIKHYEAAPENVRKDFIKLLKSVGAYGEKENV